MSRDIFVQALPSDVQSVQDIPDDWMPGPLPFTASDVIGAVRGLAPAADFSTPAWGRVTLPGVDVEVSLPQENPLQSFALHVRGGDMAAADAFVESLLQQLSARAFDPEGAPRIGIFGNG